MNTLEVKLQDVDITNLSLAQITKVPVLGVLQEFWNGSYESMLEHLKNYDVDVDKANNFQSLDEVITFANHIFKKLELMNNKKEGLGQFDFRLASVFKSRYLTNFSLDDLKTLVFDISSFDNPEARVVLKDIFMQSSSTSFIEFKEIDGNLLYYTYSRKALMVDGERLTIATSRERVNLAEDYKSIKDANFVSSKLVLSMAEKMSKLGLAEANFHTKTLTPKYEFEKTYSVAEILSFSEMSLEQKEAKARTEEIRKQAEKEVKEERQLTRTSLENDSMKSYVENSKTEVRVETNSSFLAKANYNSNDFVNKLFEEYEQKEIEKSKIRLQKAKSDGNKAYNAMKLNLANGLPILEAIRTTKQEFRDDETIMFASLMLTKDLLGSMDMQSQITDLKTKLLEKEKEVDKIAESLTKKEESIKEYQAATTKKSNEINILKEEYKKNIEEMKNQMQEQISLLKKEYENKVKEADGIIDEQAKLIDRLKVQNDSTNKLFEEARAERDTLNSKVHSLEKNNALLEAKNNELESNKTQYKDSNDKIKELKIKNELLEKENAKKDLMLERIISGTKANDVVTNKKEKENIDTRRVSDILKQ